MKRSDYGITEIHRRIKLLADFMTAHRPDASVITISKDDYETIMAHRPEAEAKGFLFQRNWLQLGKYRLRRAKDESPTKENEND